MVGICMKIDEDSCKKHWRMQYCWNDGRNVRFRLIFYKYHFIRSHVHLRLNKAECLARWKNFWHPAPRKTRRIQLSEHCALFFNPHYNFISNPIDPCITGTVSNLHSATWHQVCDRIEPPITSYSISRPSRWLCRYEGMLCWNTQGYLLHCHTKQ